MLNLDLIELNLAARSAPEALAEMNHALSGCPAVANEPELLRALLERHALGDTCLDQQVAIPHARTAAVDRVVVAVGRSAGGVYFNPEADRVRLIFLIGVPPGMAGEYLKTVAQIARIVRDRSLRRHLLEVSVAEDFLAYWAAGFGQLAR